MTGGCIAHGSTQKILPEAGLYTKVGEARYSCYYHTLCFMYLFFVHPHTFGYVMQTWILRQKYHQVWHLFLEGEQISCVEDSS